MGTATKHPAPELIKPSFISFWHLGTLQAIWHSTLSVRVPGCQKLQMTA